MVIAERLSDRRARVQRASVRDGEGAGVGTESRIEEDREFEAPFTKRLVACVGNAEIVARPFASGGTPGRVV